MNGISTYRVPLQVLVYCYRIKDSKVEFLFLKRSEERGGFWQGVTGAPEKGEDMAQAARRELQEEIGCTPKSIRQIDFKNAFFVEPQFKHLYHPAVQRIEEYVFLAEIQSSDTVKLSAEHSEFKWDTADQGINLLKYQGNKDALRACTEELL